MVTSARLNISGANLNPSTPSNTTSANFSQQLKKQGYFPGQTTTTQTGFLGSKQTTYSNPNNGTQVTLKEFAPSGYQMSLSYKGSDGKPVSVTVGNSLKGNLTVTATFIDGTSRELTLGPNAKVELSRASDGSLKLFIDSVEASEAVGRRGALVNNFGPATKTEYLK